MRRPSIVLGILAGLLCQTLVLPPVWSASHRYRKSHRSTHSHRMLAQKSPSQKPMMLNAFVQQTTKLPTLQQDPAIEQDTANQQGVVGLDLSIRPGDFPLVQNVFKGSPADRAGLRPGDIVLTVDGVSTHGKSREAVDRLISDVPGTAVRFDVNRDGTVMPFGLKVISLSSLTRSLRQFYAAQPDFPKR